MCRFSRVLGVLLCVLPAFAVGQEITQLDADSAYSDAGTSHQCVVGSLQTLAANLESRLYWRNMAEDARATCIAENRDTYWGDYNYEGGLAGYNITNLNIQAGDTFVAAAEASMA